MFTYPPSRVFVAGMRLGRRRPHSANCCHLQSCKAPPRHLFRRAPFPLHVCRAFLWGPTCSATWTRLRSTAVGRPELVSVLEPRDCWTNFSSRRKLCRMHAMGVIAARPSTLRHASAFAVRTRRSLIWRMPRLIVRIADSQAPGALGASNRGSGNGRTGL